MPGVAFTAKPYREYTSTSEPWGRNEKREMKDRNVHQTENRHSIRQESALMSFCAGNIGGGGAQIVK